MGLSSFGESLVLATLTGSVFVSLHADDPGNAGGNEIAGSAYTRIAGGVFALLVVGDNPTTYANTIAVQFPVSSGAWGDITHFGLWTAATGGAFIGGDNLDVSRDLELGDAPVFLPGDLKLQVN